MGAQPYFVLPHSEAENVLRPTPRDISLQCHGTQMLSVRCNPWAPSEILSDRVHQGSVGSGLGCCTTAEGDVSSAALRFGELKEVCHTDCNRQWPKSAEVV
jgi:hypothetical protein